MNHNIMIAVCSAVLAFSCTKESNQGMDNAAKQEHQTPKVQELHIDEYMSTEAGLYVRAYETTDFYVQLSSLKPSPLESEQIATASGQRHYQSTKAIQDLGTPHSIMIDNIPIIDTKVTTKINGALPNLKNLYGKTVTYQFVPTTVTKGIETPLIEVSQYVPTLIEITSPRVTNDDEMYPICYGGNFILRWNADPYNKAGLIVSVDWTGEKIYGPNYDGQTVRRTAFIPEDNGEYKLDPKMFDHIPNTALVFITLLRGNIENTLIGDYSYNISSETHAVLPFILCRYRKQQ